MRRELFSGTAPYSDGYGWVSVYARGAPQTAVCGTVYRCMHDARNASQSEGVVTLVVWDAKCARQRLTLFSASMQVALPEEYKQLVDVLDNTPSAVRSVLQLLKEKEHDGSRNAGATQGAGGA